MESKCVTICFSNLHQQEGLLNVSTQGNWFETVPNQHTGASFVEVAQSLRNRSMKGTLCCFSYNGFVRQITFSFPLSLVAHSLHNVFFQLVLD